MAAADDLDVRFRRADPHAWLGSRFIPDAAARADVAVLNLFADELGRIAATVQDRRIAAIRFAWWAEHLDRGAAAPPTGHPVADALTDLLARGAAEPSLLTAMIDDAEGLAPGPGYVPPLMGAVARRLDRNQAAEPLTPIAAAWSLALGLAHAPTPEVGAAFAEAWPEARAASGGLSAAAFPAVCHVALAPRMARGRPDQPVRDRLRVLGAVLGGRL